MSLTRHGMGWRRDIYDPRDLRFSAGDASASLPPRVTHLWTPPILNQRATNSCVGHGSASLFMYMLHWLNKPVFQPSPFFNYWLARHVPRIGWEDVDEGAMPRDAMQSMISNGVVMENLWPFDYDRVNVRPPQDLLHLAKENRVVEGKYVRMLANDNLYHLKYSLAQGLPFLIGIDVYSSFYDTDKGGLVRMPKISETFEGGHLMYSNGYITSEAPQWPAWLRDRVRGDIVPDPDGYFRCPNSWGTEEGDEGIFWIPFAYARNAGLAGDFWRIEAIT